MSIKKMDQKIEAFYQSHLEQYGSESPKAVAWADQNSQEHYFNALFALGNLEKTSLLDYGCGLGHLYGFLKGKNISVDYTGMDITKSYIASAQKKFPETRFIHTNLREKTLEEPFDYVTALGTFHMRGEYEADQYYEHVLEPTLVNLFNITRKALLFTVFNEKTPGVYKKLGIETVFESFYLSQKQENQIIEKLAPQKVKVVRNQGRRNTNDFIYLYK